MVLADLIPTEAGTSQDEPLIVSVAHTAAEWDAYVRTHTLGTVDHLWFWRRVFSDVFGHDSEYIAARRGGHIVGVLPLVLFRSRLFGRSIVSLPMLNYGGMLVDDERATFPLLEEAQRIAREFGARYVELRHTARLTSLPARQHKVSLRMPLPASADALWQALDRKVRNQVRKGQKSGFEVEAGGARLVGDFYRVFAENMRDLGTPVYSKRLFSTVADLFDGATLHLVRHKGKPVAGGVTLEHNATVLVPWGSSLKAYRQSCPNMLLYWSMMEHAIARGARVFDFGRSSPDAGTMSFKLQWGAGPEPQFWEYILLNRSELPDHQPSNPRFSLAIEGWKRLPLWAANRLGPAVVRHIP